MPIRMLIAVAYLSLKTIRCFRFFERGHQIACIFLLLMLPVMTLNIVFQFSIIIIPKTLSPVVTLPSGSYYQ